VTGFITRGRGITVHLSGCRQLLALEPERRIKVEWHETGKAKHSGEVRILCNDKPGMLAEVGAVCKTVGINVTKLEAKSVEDNKAVLDLEVTITSVKELQRFMRSLEKVSGIIAVERMRSAVGGS
jgi:guanosine-3',5'-bis(diphosphate) 3'-pyrophosphohydrolase